MKRISLLFISAMLLTPMTAHAACSSYSTTNPNALPAMAGWEVGASVFSYLTLDSNCALNVDIVAGGGTGGGTVAQGAPGTAAAGWFVVPGTGATWTLGAGSATIGAISNSTFAATQSGTWNIGSITTLPAITGTVTANPPSANSGTPTQTTGTCGTSSGTILAANSATTAETFWMLSTDANGVWLRFDGGTAAQSKPSFYIGPGGPLAITFTAAGGNLPTAAITCIASASISVGEIYK